jgi:putative SOS response-associated peptidase YedK
LMAAEACLTVILSGSINAVTSAIHDRMPVILDQEEGRQQESELAS